MPKHSLGDCVQLSTPPSQKKSTCWNVTQCWAHGKKLAHYLTIHTRGFCKFLLRSFYQWKTNKNSLALKKKKREKISGVWGTCYSQHHRWFRPAISDHASTKGLLRESLSSWQRIPPLCCAQWILCCARLCEVNQRHYSSHATYLFLRYYTGKHSCQCGRNFLFFWLPNVVVLTNTWVRTQKCQSQPFACKLDKHIKKIQQSLRVWLMT